MGEQENKQIKDLLIRMVKAQVNRNKSNEGPAVVQAILHSFQEKEYLYIVVEVCTCFYLNV